MVNYKFLRALLVLLGLISLGAAGHTIYDFWLKKDDVYLAAVNVRNLEHGYEVQERSKEGHLKPYASYALLHTLEVVGKKAVADEATQSEEVEALAVGPDDFVLVMVQFASDSPSTSSVFIRPASGAVGPDGLPSGDLYSIGDRVTLADQNSLGVDVLDIRENEVDLQLETKEEPPFTLVTTTFDVDPNRIRGGAGEAIWHSNIEQTRMLTPGHYEVGVNDIQNISEMSEDQLVAAIPLRPVRDDNGKVRGLRVASLKDDSLFARQGLRADDILLSVNGHRATDRAELMRWLRSQPNLDSVTVEVERFGAPRTISYRLPRR